MDIFTRKSLFKLAKDKASPKVFDPWCEAIKEVLFVRFFDLYSAANQVLDKKAFFNNPEVSLSLFEFMQ